MSTKLHYGYRLAAGMSPFTFIAAARTVLDPIRDQIDATFAMDLFTAALDKAAATGGPAPTIMDIVFTWDDAQGKLPERSRVRDIHRLELVFGQDPVTDRIGMIPYAEAPELTAAFDTLDGVEPYPYWDNADTPADVSDTEWQDRADFWNRVEPAGAVPAEIMLTWRLRANPGLSDILIGHRRWDDLRQCVPDLGTRAQHLASTLLKAALPNQPDTRTRSKVDWQSPAGQALLATCQHLCLPVDREVLLGHRALDNAALTEARQQAQTAAVAFADWLRATDPGEPTSQP